MNFRTFKPAFTTIFPASNSHNGGQLVTEYNLRCRDTVATDSSIKYEVGPSFAHSVDDDFAVRPLSDDSGNPIDYGTVEVTPGRALVNGHFVKTTESMSVNLVEVNAQLAAESKPVLKGNLAIGIRAYYATEQTIAGSILVEDTAQDVYLGFQLIILPEDEFITPIDSPSDKSAITAHLKLATFTFNNNTITNVKPAVHKCEYIPAERIADVDHILSANYVRKTGLNSKKIYAFAGKGIDPATGYDTWEDVTDSMVIWDAAPQKTSSRPPYTQAMFEQSNDSVFLVVPHKQVEGMTDSRGNAEYYLPRPIELPVANYNSGTPGIVNKSYTNAIKVISEKVELFRTTLHGKQIMFIDEKTTSTVLPYINPAWENGDYILVGKDFTANDDASSRPPSTLYVVLPGYVASIAFVSKVDDSDVPPTSLHGACIGIIYLDAASGDSPPNTTDPSAYPVFYTANSPVRGEPEQDYFAAVYKNGAHYSIYYYKVATSGSRAYSEFVPLTGEIPLAQEDTIGGFLNVSTDYTDQGYVYRDEYGRLKLLDYAFIRSGTLAYQLGEDLTLPNGVAASEVQAYLDEYVNERIVFPNDETLYMNAVPNMINIYMYLTAEDGQVSVTLRDLDSRFGTGVYLHILGDATANTTLNIVDCEKIRIDSTISGTPTINIYRSNLYYDPVVMNYIASCSRTYGTGFNDLKLWYYKFDDVSPDLVVNELTVSEMDAPIIPENISYWNVTQPNDNHYLVALRSITFNAVGEVTGCSLLVANDSTDNVVQGERIMVGDFNLPQGSGLSYPVACMTKPLRVVGTFTSAYYSETSWYTTDTTFTAVTSIYDPDTSGLTATGNIAFHSKTTLVNVDVGTTTIPVWDSGTYNIFYGGSV